MEKIRFVNDFLRFMQPIEEAPKELLNEEYKSKPLFLDFELTSYEYDENAAQKRIAEITETGLFNTGNLECNLFGLPVNNATSEIASQQKNDNYICMGVKFMQTVFSTYKYVRQAYVCDEKEPYFYTVYLLTTADGKNCSCIIYLGELFCDIEQYILPGARKEARQYFKRNAPLFTKLFHAFKGDPEVLDTQFIVASSTASFIDIPVMVNGVMLTENPDSEKFYEDILKFTVNILSQYNYVNDYLKFLRAESIYLDAEKNEISPSYFTRDLMKDFITAVDDIKDNNLKDDVLFTGKTKRKLDKYSRDVKYTKNGDIEEFIQLINTDYNPSMALMCKVMYRYKWGCGLEEISANFCNGKLGEFLMQCDEYELERFMPTVYKAYLHGSCSEFDKGALILSNKCVYFRYVYKYDDKNDEDEILRKTTDLCTRLFLEFHRFIDYKSKSESKLKQSKSEAERNYMGRYFMLNALTDLFSF